MNTPRQSDPQKIKALQAALSQIDKQFGKGAVMRLGDRPMDAIETISTGSLGLDIALGIGGLPRGRVVEIYGPESSGKTTLTLQVIAQCQKAGGTAAFIDAEHALDPTYAEKLGVDVGNLLVSQPDTGEQALEIADMLVRSSGVDVVVIDSVAALTPKAEIEGDMGDSHVGLQARLMSQALRKLTANIKKSGTLVIFINQIRMKIGVMFGCFHYGSRVLLADGSRVKIGKLVNERRPVEVMSWNPETGACEPRKVLNWFNNGRADGFLQIVVSGGKSGRRQMSVTPNHTIFTPEGERSAGELRVGDEVLARVPDFDFTMDQRQLLLGSCLGDGSIRPLSRNTACFRFGHGIDQLPYIEWKKQMLGSCAGEVAIRKDGRAASFDIRACKTASMMRSSLYGDGSSRQVTEEHLSEMDARALAVWYMDDGTFHGSHAKHGNGRALLCNKSLDEDSRQRVLSWFARLGMVGVSSRHDGFSFNSQATRKLHELVAPFIHPSMAYKLKNTYHGQFGWDMRETRSLVEMRRDVVGPEQVLAIYDKPQTRNPYKYDLEVDGNHNYMVDGIVVHNSPETTTGGNALKFYASVRLDIRRIGAVKRGEQIIGSETRVKVVKNKVAPPFRQTEFEILYGEGTSREGELIELGVLHGLVEKSGAWYSYNGDRIGQGKDNVRGYLKENPNIADDIDQQLRAKLLTKAEGADLGDDEAGEEEES